MVTKYNIYKFDARALLLGKKEGKVIKCDSALSNSAREIVTKGDSLLFYQLHKRFPDRKMESLICILDFSSFIEHHGEIDEALKDFEDGFEVVINNLDKDGNEEYKETKIRFKDFLKSNSMSKDCQIYYLNADKDVYDLMNEVAYFGFDNSNKEVELSKLYAYSGTLCSDVTILDQIKFKPGELVVINDKEITKDVDECITGISCESLYAHIVNIRKTLKDNKILEESIDYKKMNCYSNAINYLKLQIERLPEKYKTSKSIIELIEGYINCKEKNFNDLLSFVESNSKYGSNSKGEIEWFPIKVKNYPVDLNMFDGEGLISLEFQKEITNYLGDKYNDLSSFQIRMPYVKGMAHSCDFKKFFKDNGIATIKGIDDKEYPIENVKIILTKSMFKCSKFISKDVSCIDWYISTINKYNYPFGFVKKQQSNKELVKLQYEYISTLPLTQGEIEVLINRHNDYINDNCTESEIIDSLDDNFKYIYNSGNAGKDFILKSSSFKTIRRSIFNSLKEDAEFSRFYVQGTQKYLSGDLLELLYWCAKISFPEEQYLPCNMYYMPCEPDTYKEHAVILRSPHYSRNEIGILLRDSSNELRNQYFGHLNSVLMVNPTSFVSDRIGGADYDGDLALVIRENTIVNNVKKYIVGNYPVIKIPSLNANKHKYSYLSKLICCQNTFSGRVGQISNMALKDSIVQYNENNKQADFDRIAFYTILNGLEIDSAKNGKKPRLPKGKKDKDEAKDIIDYFFDAKKEYMGKEKSYGSKAKVKLLDRIGYDDLENNIIYAFKYSYNCIKPNFRTKRLEKYNYDISIKESAEILAIQHLYSKANSMISNALSKHGRKANAKKAVASITLIDQILNGQDISAEEFINELQHNLNSNQAYKKLCEYVQADKKYHFDSTIKGKYDFIQNLGLNISDRLAEILFRTGNENYRLLYLGLYCISKNTNAIQIYEETNDECLDDLKSIDGLFGHYENFYNTNRTILENYINNHINDKVESIKGYVLKTLTDLGKGYSFNTIKKTINIYTSNLMNDIFYEQLKKHFMEVE